MTVLDACPIPDTSLTTSTNGSKFFVNAKDSVTSADVAAESITISSNLAVLVESDSYCGKTLVVSYKTGLSLETDISSIFGAEKTFNLLINCVKCTQAFTSFPSVLTAFDKVYKLGSTSTELAFTGLNNGECKFSLELLESVNGVLQAIDSAIFNYTPPVISKNTTKVDTYWYNVVGDGYLTIYAPVGTTHKTLYNMVLKMTSISNVADVRTHEFSFVVTITEDCSQKFNDPSTNTFTYAIEAPEVS